MKTWFWFRRETAVWGWWLLLAAALAGSALRLHQGIIHNPMKSRFGEMARHWENGGIAHFVNPGSFLQGLDAPGYQVFMLGLRQLTQDNALAIGIFIGLLSALTPWLYYWAIRRLGLARLPSLGVLLALVWNPAWMVLYWFFVSQTLALALTGLGLLVAAFYQAAPTGEKFLLGVGVWTVAALTAPMLLPLGLLIMGWLWWRQSRRWMLLGMAFILMTLLILPSAIRSWSILGYPEPFGNDWPGRIQYTTQAGAVQVEFTHAPGQVETRGFRSPNLASARQVLQPFSSWQMPVASETRIIRIQKANGDADWRTALRRINDNKTRFISRWQGNLIHLAVAAAWPEPYQENSFLGAALNAQRWLWGPLILAAGLLSLVSLGMGNRDLLVIATFAACAILITQNGRFLEGRDRKPLEPLLLAGVVWMAARRTWVGVPGTLPAAAAETPAGLGLKYPMEEPA